MRQARSRSRFAPVKHRMINLVAHQLDTAVGSEPVQVVPLFIADGCARGIVGTVYQNEFGFAIGAFLDFLHVDPETVLPAQAIEPRLQPERLRQRGKWWVSRMRQDDVA